MIQVNRGQIVHIKKTLITKKETTEEIYDPKLGLPLIVTVSPIVCDDNEFVSSVHIAKDISEWKISARALTCLYEISRLIKKYTIFKELLQEIIKRVSFAWQYPEITGARIMVDEQIFMTDNFREAIWKQDADIEEEGKKAGVVKVFYLLEKSELDEGPFLVEERNLINALAEQIGRIQEHNRSKNIFSSLKLANSLSLSRGVSAFSVILFAFSILSLMMLYRTVSLHSPYTKYNFLRTFFFESHFLQYSSRSVVYEVSK